MRARSSAGASGAAAVVAACLLFLSLPAIAGAAVSRVAATGKALRALGVTRGSQAVRVADRALAGGAVTR
jgi:hypothetical protein